MLTQEQAADIRNRETQLKAWLGDRTSYRPEEIPTDINPPTNDERSALEVFEFTRDKPERYFLYITEETKIATTWTGEKLGTVVFGSQWCDNFGGIRIPVTINAVNGERYHGTYYKSAGNYARVKKCKAK